VDSLKVGDRVWVERVPGYKERGTVVEFYDLSERPNHWWDKIDVKLDNHCYPSTWNVGLVSKIGPIDLLAEA
jgi:hypothetical protein